MTNNLRCPDCGRQFHVVGLCSNPMQYEGGCETLHFSIRFFERKDSSAQMTQEEIDAIYKERKVAK